MSLLCRLYNRYLVRGFLLNSLPKSGTHLLAKVCSLLPGIRLNAEPIVHIGPDTLKDFHKPDDPPDDSVTLDVTCPRSVARNACRRALQQIRHGQFRHTHAPFHPKFFGLLTELGMKTVLILRDPRDVVVSAARFYIDVPHNPLHALFKPLSHPDRIMLAIRGREPEGPGQPRLCNIAEACRSLMPWLNQPCNYTTHFHRLVGPPGGGAAREQMTELTNLARHLGCFCRQRDLEEVAARAFGGTRTFRHGIAGGWREYFTEEHVNAFKEVAGSLLIELGYEKDLNWSASRGRE